MKRIRIGDREIGSGRATFVIAEIGVNHDGSVERAIELVGHAKAAGADAIKLQVFRAAALMHPSSAFAGYQRERVDAADPAEMLRTYELGEEGLRWVIGAARDAGLVPLATPFSLSDVEMLAELDLPALKVASPDLVNWPLIKRVVELKRPVILLTGAATMEEVGEAVGWMTGWGADFALLHCISSYPTGAGEANLGWIGELGRFGVPVGYSDHTTEVLAGGMAVAAGAVMVEKHLTYDRNAAGPDHAASAAPEEFAEYVKAIRLAEALRGSGSKRVLEVEEDVRRVSRQSLVTARDLAAGEVIGEGDLMVQRPGTGIPAGRWVEVVGRKAAGDVAKGRMLEWGDLAE